MTDTVQIIFGILIPFFGTAVGAATVFFLKNQISPSVQRALMGFASGVMFAASVWSLIIPSIEMSDGGAVPKWVPAATGFILGTVGLLLLDKLVARIYAKRGGDQLIRSPRERTLIMALAITLHNIPEGMAVGVVFASVITECGGVALAGAMAFSIGIAIQNIPEGSIISMPMRSSGIKKGKAFTGGVLSGIVEPIGALITLALTSIISAALPYILSFAAGAMIYVTVEELIPEAHDENGGGICAMSVMAGFLLMMILDVALG